MTAEEKLNAATNALKKVLSAVQRHLPPNGISEREAIGEIIEAVDPWPLGDTVSVEIKRTAEDKIKEVMELIATLTTGVHITAKHGATVGDGEDFQAMARATRKAREAVETKLRQLIKDDE